MNLKTCGVPAALTAALGLLLLTEPAAAATFTYDGTTVGAPTWNRPIEDGSALSANGNAVPFSVFQFQVTQAGDYTFNSQQAGTFNGFIFVYQGTFNPLTPLNNFLAANNNITPGNQTQSRIQNLSLVTGLDYFFVTTGVQNTDFGTFRNSILGGPGDAVPTPEPASVVGFLALGAGGVLSRKRDRHPVI
ncbi:PEP-CTERM sorting domain-containing protein [Anthocerotibacter panamensis]|uniref:PEP-CTERM sorting domain-containing protein n=1 Tax=Anthocerotibacter panamensis TaxID=2857077 RepID=UPI001C407ABB|nr:PEP-CTERM sorting domain-containing protein [Anthocerotibacter panamensis]